MAVESKRGCGYRKVGGLYMMSVGAGMPCCKMPLALTVCPCCGEGIKQARGWTWIDAGKMFGGANAKPCVAGAVEKVACPAANPAVMGRCGLLWVGEKFYPTPADFLKEAAEQGISRRMKSVPRGFEADKTWVLFAHPKAIQAARRVADAISGEKSVWIIVDPKTNEAIVDAGHFDDYAAASQYAAAMDLKDPVYIPGVIRITRPHGFEKIVKQSEFDQVAADRASFEANDHPDEKVREESKSALLKAFEADAKRGVKWVPVPDNDPDHQGSVYDKEKGGDEE